MGLFEPFRGPRGRVVERSGAEIVGIILACGISGALNIVTFALVYDVVSSDAATAPLSENTTQVLTGWGGGMLAVLAAYIGYTFGKQQNNNPNLPPDNPDIEEDLPLLPPLPPTPRPPQGPQQPPSRRPQSQQPRHQQRPPPPPQPPKQLPDVEPGTQGPGTPPPAGPDYPGYGGQQ
jgi:hypothetical protein